MNKKWLEKKYWEDGFSLKEIAAEANVTSTTILRRMKKWQIPRRTISAANKKYHERFEDNAIKRNARQKARRAKIVIPVEILHQMYLEEKKSTTQIAETFNCSSVTVVARLKENDIPVRTPAERKKGKLNPMHGLKGEKHHRYGTLHTEKTREKIKEKVPRGAEHFRYKMPHNRIEPVNIQIRNCYKMKMWRNEILKRDNRKCQGCGAGTEKNLHVDHIIPFAVIKKENNIKSLKQALQCKKLWAQNNGRTLCEKCHKSTKTWGVKTKRLLKEMEDV